MVDVWTGGGLDITRRIHTGGSYRSQAVELMLGQLITAFLPRPRADTTVQTLGHPAAGVVGWFDTSEGAGVNVTPNTALTVSAFWCAIRVISETLASFPCILYERVTDDGRERAKDDYRYYLLRNQPHPAISPVSFFETLTAHAAMTGNCFARIIRRQDTTVERLEPQLPDNIEIKLDRDGLYYCLKDRPGTEIRSEDMLHMHGLGPDALQGWSLIRYARETLGGALAAEQRVNKQHNNGAIPAGLLVHPMRLDKPARENLRREWDEIHKGSQNQGKVGIVHGGMDFKTLGMSNEDAQFFELYARSVLDVSRFTRVPPHMLGDLSNSAVRANIEQQALEFIQYCMKPWKDRWEQELNRKLLSDDEQKTMYFEFNMDSLLQGDIKSRYEAYAIGRQWGFLNVNTIMRRENMNTIDNGDIYLQPSNMVEAGTMPVQPQPATQPNPATAEAAEMIRQESILMFRSRLACLVRIERAEVSKAAVRQETRGEPFIPWMESWYSAYPWVKQSIEDKPFQQAWEAESKRLLLLETDGPQEGFAERINDALKQWPERTKTATPTEK